MRSTDDLGELPSCRMRTILKEVDSFTAVKFERDPNKITQGWVSSKYLAELWTHSKTHTRLFGGNSGVQECLQTGENWVNYAINYAFPGYDYWIYHHKSPKNSHQLPSSKRRFRVLPRQQLKGALQRNGFPVQVQHADLSN